MSKARIVRSGGEGENIASVSAAEVKTYGGVSFRSMRMEGTYNQQELDEKLKIAKEDGRKDGVRQAEQKLSAPIKAGLENIETILDELSRFRGDLFKEAEEEVLNLVNQISKKIVMKELALDPHLVKEVVAKGIEHLEKQRKIRMIVSPQNHDLFKISKPDYLERFKGVESLEISVDPQLPQGAAVLETRACSIDLNLEKMVDHVLSQATSGQKSSPEVNDGETPS